MAPRAVTRRRRPIKAPADAPVINTEPLLGSLRLGRLFARSAAITITDSNSASARQEPLGTSSAVLIASNGRVTSRVSVCVYPSAEELLSQYTAAILRDLTRSYAMVCDAERGSAMSRNGLGDGGGCACA